MSRGHASPPGECAALDHLARTRHRLREALPPSHPGAARPTPLPGPCPIPGQASAISPTPGDDLRQALAQAWHAHPVHQGAELAAALARLALQGAAERNPLGLVLGAGVVGMVLAHSRPWRLLIRPVLRSGWPFRLAVDVLAQVPVHCWVAVLAASPADKARP